MFVIFEPSVLVRFPGRFARPTGGGTKRLTLFTMSPLLVSRNDRFLFSRLSDLAASVPTYADEQFHRDILTLHNRYRFRHGSGPLTMNHAVSILSSTIWGGGKPRKIRGVKGDRFSVKFGITVRRTNPAIIIERRTNAVQLALFTVTASLRNFSNARFNVRCNFRRVAAGTVFLSRAE